MSKSVERSEIGLLQQIERVLAAGSPAVVATVADAPTNIGWKILVEASGVVTGSLGDSELDEAVAKRARDFLESRDEAHLLTVESFAPALSEWAQARILFERLQPEPHVVVCGAGHVGAALARLASFIGYRVTLFDDRAEFVARELFADPGINLIAAKSWSAAVREAIGSGHGVSVAVVTRGHSEDEECLRTVMTTAPEYVGLIGSKRRTRIVLERVRVAGASEEQIKRVHAPIGLDIGAITPEEVALSILAEIVAQRRGGQGGFLSVVRSER